MSNFDQAEVVKTIIIITIIIRMMIIIIIIIIVSFFVGLSSIRGPLEPSKITDGSRLRREKCLQIWLGM